MNGKSKTFTGGRGQIIFLITLRTSKSMSRGNSTCGSQNEMDAGLVLRSCLVMSWVMALTSSRLPAELINSIRMSSLGCSRGTVTPAIHRQKTPCRLIMKSISSLAALANSMPKTVNMLCNPTKLVISFALICQRLPTRLILLIGNRGGFAL